MTKIFNEISNLMLGVKFEMQKAYITKYGEYHWQMHYNKLEMTFVIKLFDVQQQR